MPSPPSPSPSRDRWLLGLILIAAAALRFYHLPQLGFWTDELFSLSDANGWGLRVAQLPALDVLLPPQPHYTWRSEARPLPAMIGELGRSEIHPPLYFLMLRGWEALFGSDDEATVRSLGVLLSLAAIGLLYAAVCEQGHRPSVGLWACALMAVAGPQVEYAQEARDYVPLITFSLAAAVPLLRIERRGVSAARLFALAGACLGMMLCNYFAVALIGAMGIYAVVQLRGRPRRATLVALGAAVVLYAAVWGPLLLRQMPRFVHGHTWLLDDAPGRWRREAMSLLTLPARFLFEQGRAGASVGIAPWLGVLWLLLIPGLFRRSSRLWALWVVTPVLVIGVSDWRSSLSQLAVVRFTLGATPGLYVLIASAWEPASLRWRQRQWFWLRGALPAACVGVALIALPRAYTPPWKLDLRTPAYILGSRFDPAVDGLVFVGREDDPVWTAVCFNGIRHYLRRDPATLAVIQHRAGPVLLGRLSRCRTVWVVARPLAAPLATYLPGYKIVEQGEVPDFMTVMRGSIPRPATAPAPQPGSTLPP